MISVNTLLLLTLGLIAGFNLGAIRTSATVNERGVYVSIAVIAIIMMVLISRW